VNSPGWDFGGRPTPDGRYLMFTSNRAYTDRPLDRALDYRELLAKIRAPGNGLRDVYRVEMASLDLPRCGAAARASPASRDQAATTSGAVTTPSAVSSRKRASHSARSLAGGGGTPSAAARGAMLATLSAM
jgi:hypothetical protein